MYFQPKVSLTHFYAQGPLSVILKERTQNISEKCPLTVNDLRWSKHFGEKNAW
jgi:hypothetical protein